jgi:hypothetical protein
MGNLATLWKKVSDDDKKKWKECADGLIPVEPFNKIAEDLVLTLGTPGAAPTAASAAAVVAATEEETPTE